MKAEPVQLAGALRQFPGKWVALKGGQVVEARDSPDQLIVALKGRSVTTPCSSGRRKSLRDPLGKDRHLILT